MRRWSYAAILVLAAFARVAEAQTSVSFDTSTPCADRSTCAECLHDTSCIYCAPGKAEDGKCVDRNVNQTLLCMGDGKANDTETGPNFEKVCPTRVIDSAFTYTLAVLIFTMMLGMGATVSLEDLKFASKTPLPVLTGFASQYLLLPVLCFLLALAFQLPNAVAIGLVLLASTPGGTTSQLWTYFTDGDVALSVIMTFCSTVLAFALLPFWGYVLSRPFADDTIEIPFIQIFLSLLLVVIPVSIGVALRTLVPKVANIVEKVGAGFGSVSIVVAIVLGSVVNPHIYSSGWKAYILAASVPFLGMFFGHVLAHILRQTPKHRRTIGWETGIQNSSLTIAVCSFSFKQPVVGDVLVIPLIYSLFIFIDGLIIVGLYHVWFKKHFPDEAEEHCSRSGSTSHDDDRGANVEVRVSNSVSETSNVITSVSSSSSDATQFGDDTDDEGELVSSGSSTSS